MIKEFRQKAANWLDPYRTSSPYSGYFQTIQPPRLGVTEMLEGYSSMPWLRAVTSKIGQAVGSTSWKLYEEGTEKKLASRKIQRAAFAQRQALVAKAAEKGDLVEVDDHPLLQLLERGGPVLSGPSLLHTTSLHLDLVGEAFWVLQRDIGKRVTDVWLATPNMVMELPSTLHKFYVMMIGTKRLEVAVEDVIFFKDPDPLRPYERGVGIANALGDELEIDEYAAKYLKNFFANSARPDMIISGDGLARGDTVRLQEAWLLKHQGVLNAHRTHFINRKVDVHELGQDFNSMGMNELRKAERDAVMQVFGVPPELFGVLSNSNRSTIGAADYFWNRNVITPRVERIRGMLQRQLVPMFDEKLILDFESPVTEDGEYILDVMSKNPEAFSVNEWREQGEKETLGAAGEKYINPGKPQEQKPTG